MMLEKPFSLSELELIEDSLIFVKGCIGRESIGEFSNIDKVIMKVSQMIMEARN